MYNVHIAFLLFSWLNGSDRLPNWQWLCPVYGTPDIISYITDGDNYPQSWWQRHGRGYWFDDPSLVITSHQIVIFALVTLWRGLWQMSDVCSLVSWINSTLLLTWDHISHHCVTTALNFSRVIFGRTVLYLDLRMQNHKFNKRVFSV